MDLQTWTSRTVDRQRQKRLVIGYIAGSCVVGSLFTALALAKKPPVAEAVEDNILDVALAEEPEPDEPEPEAQVEPEPEPQNTPPQPQARGPVLPEIATPEEIPDDAPAEATPSDNPYASSDPYAFGAGQRGAAGRGPVKVVVAQEPAPKAARKPGGPVRVTADTVPPEQIAGNGAAYPASAKAAGIEGTVIVKYVVDTSGNPTNIESVRGPEALRSACEDSVRSLKFTPAKSKTTGEIVSVHKIKKCTFRLKT